MRPSLLLLAGPLALAALSGCRDARAAGDGIAPIPVQATPVASAAPAATVIATGTLVGKEEIGLSFKIGGIVSRVAVEPGAVVHAGDVLAELAPTEIGAEVTKATEAHAKAARDLARVTRLHADSVATLEQLQDATTALQVAESNLRIATFNRDYAVIRAPFDGVVLQRTAEVGQLASPGMPVVQLRTLRKGLVVRAGVPDRDAVRLHVGDRAEVRFTALPDTRLVGTVTQVAAAASPGTGTYAVEVALAPTSAPLVDGLIADVSIGLRGAAAVPVLPVESLLEADGDSAAVFVLAADGRTARRRAVRIGALAGGVVPVTRGVAAGERVVTAGAAYLTDGARVAVAEARRAAP